MPAPAQGRGRPDPGVGRRRVADRLRHQRIAGRPARAHRASRRLRRAGRPAAPGRRRPGSARSLTRRARLNPCAPDSWHARRCTPPGRVPGRLRRQEGRHQRAPEAPVGRAHHDRRGRDHQRLAGHEALPDGVTGLLSATGQGNHSPAFKGKVKVVTGGSTLNADVVAAEGKLKAKTSFAPIFLKIDPASLQGARPGRPPRRRDGVTQILVQTKSLKDGDKSRDGSDVLTTITGTLPGSVVRTIIPSADATATFAVTTGSPTTTSCATPRSPDRSTPTAATSPTPSSSRPPTSPVTIKVP